MGVLNGISHMCKASVIVAILGLSHFQLGAAQECTVTIQNGTIVGASLSTLEPTRNVCGYLGIPFAAPPVGPLRFKAPQPPQSWSPDPLVATTLPKWCPQDITSAPPEVEVSEDCLYLNVYVPQTANSSSGLPVMIWIYGGSFRTGSTSMYSHTRFMSKADDIILVVIQYRIGLLGFLSTGDSYATGNFGLKDQSQSIRWVSENILQFGGNPNKVTVFGESAGAFSAIFQLMAPMNKGLIHGVIAQSGSPLSLVGIDRYPLDSAKEMAGRLGCPIDSSQSIVACLQETSWEDIVAEQQRYVTESYQNLIYAMATMTAVIEPNLPGAFLTEEPLEVLKNGDIPDIPIILGGMKHEGSMYLARLYLYYFGPGSLDQDPVYMRQDIVPDLLRFFTVEEDVANRAVAASLEVAYLSGANRSSWNESAAGLSDILSVFIFKSSIQETADILSRRNMRVYLYSNEHESENSLWPVFIGPSFSEVPVEHGASHADDLMYLFDFNVTFTPQDQIFSDLLCDLWLDFGRFGNPTPIPSDRYEEWAPYEVAEERFMKLNTTPTVQKGFRSTWHSN